MAAILPRRQWVKNTNEPASLVFQIWAHYFTFYNWHIYKQYFVRVRVGCNFHSMNSNIKKRIKKTFGV